MVVSHFPGTLFDLKFSDKIVTPKVKPINVDDINVDEDTRIIIPHFSF